MAGMSQGLQRRLYLNISMKAAVPVLHSVSFSSSVSNHIPGAKESRIEVCVRHALAWHNKRWPACHKACKGDLNISMKAAVPVLHSVSFSSSVSNHIPGAKESRIEACVRHAFLPGIIKAGRHVTRLATET
jgi:hypothetical protein